MKIVSKYKWIFLCVLHILLNLLPTRTCWGLDAETDRFLDKVEKEAFLYFWDETNPENGLTYNTNEPGSPATNTATGFMLSALVIGIERGWITRDQGYKRALTAFETFSELNDINGFGYHYINIRDGKRMWNSEVSCIDTGLFLAGVITVGEYFKNTKIEKLANTIYKRTNWKWFLEKNNRLKMAWKPERGFYAAIGSFSEGIISYILAMGSPTYAIPEGSWHSFMRPIGRYGDLEMVYVSDGSLFQYLFPMAWLDLKDKHDDYLDYWQNTIKAIKANRQYCSDNSDRSKTYAQGFWGLSASLSSGGYKVFGGKPGKNIDDGTVAPYVVGGAIPFIPDTAIKEYGNMYKANPQAVKKYGLVDAFNIDHKWNSRYVIAIDKGLTLLMIENYRTGLIWRYFMSNKYVKKGMKKAGFKKGRKDDISEKLRAIGNPSDSVSAGKRSFNIKIDGDLSEWPKEDDITLTTVDRRNVEMFFGDVKDDSDISGGFKLVWDSNFLYIAGSVTDNEIVCNRETDKIYMDDCVEIFFDTDENGFYFDKNEYDYQLGIAPESPKNKRSPQIWVWGYKNILPKNIQYAVRISGKRYFIEMKIPFTEINGFEGVLKEKTGFSIAIHDRDKDDSVNKLNWSIDVTKNPGVITYGSLILSE